MGFWQRPPLWVCLLLATSLSLLSVSMLTLGEGLKFCSRQLTPVERDIVASALDCWSRIDPDPQAIAAMRAMLRQQRLRAMDEPTFARLQERGTLGYTDEHGRILLNPRICFATWRCLGKRHPSDVVRTTSVLVHEYHHCHLNETEAQACLAELAFLRKAWLVERDAGFAREWQAWEALVTQRVRPYVGAGPGLELHCPGKPALTP